VTFLLPAEARLWHLMPSADRRHSIEVARRFEAADPHPGREAMAAALLHDVGKARCDLGTFGRVAATVFGPRTQKFRLYHDHEQIGAEMLRDAGSADLTIALVDGTSVDVATLAALRTADEI
jgi:putative nucleotidyltransferase with HDIG domain